MNSSYPVFPDKNLNDKYEPSAFPTCFKLRNEGTPSLI
jgi:hypothetical protein